MSHGNNPTASVLIIGNEILSGQVQDLNLQYLAKRLHDLGIHLRETRVVADVEGDIVHVVNRLRARYDYVFTTGGIGPTHDDITAHAIAKAFSLPIERNPEAVSRIFKKYPQRGPKDSRFKMCEIPKSATLIDNPISTAPGFQVENVFVLAGIPAIAQAMFEEIVPRLKEGMPRFARSVFCAIIEGKIASDLARIQESFEDIEIGSYPYWLKEKDKGVRIVLKGLDEARVHAATKHVIKMFEQQACSPKIMDE